MILDKTRIKLRKADLKDINLLIDNRIVFIKEILGDPTTEKESCLRISLKKYFSKSLINNSYICWIAEYDNNPVSFGGMVLREQPGTFEIPNGKTGYIMNIFTDIDFRNHGLGTLVFQKLIAEAKLLKLERLELHATPDGEPIYRKLGFNDPHSKALDLIIT